MVDVNGVDARLIVGAGAGVGAGRRKGRTTGGSKVYMEGSDRALVHRGECLMRIASHEWLAGGGGST